MRHIETTRMRLWASQAFVWDLKIISSLKLLLFKKTIFELFVDRSARDTILDHPSELFMKISSIQVQYPWKFIRKTQFPIERRKKVNNEKGERGTLYHWSFKWTYKFSCGKLKFAFSRRLNFFPINSNAYAKCAQHFKMEIHGLRNVLKGKGINSPLLLLVSRCRWEIGQPENLVLSKKKKWEEKSHHELYRTCNEVCNIFLSSSFSSSMWFFGIIGAEISTWKFYEPFSVVWYVIRESN